mmetsp:Transcript_5451/g.6961  ORF Transcript_5451/g.6961 Transcript_5451/m.6961 type:complete len:113 (+) Transcript_5451:366-704(+)|eukprot:61865_1
MHLTLPSARINSNQLLHRKSFPISVDSSLRSFDSNTDSNTNNTSTMLTFTSSEKYNRGNKNLNNFNKKRNWKPRKHEHQTNNKNMLQKQNNQGRSIGWRSGDKGRKELMMTM